MITPVLVDKRNIDIIKPTLLEGLAVSKFTGFDYETEDSKRHEGLNIFCKYNDDGSKKAGKLVFDFNKINICGASFYMENIPNHAFYLNFGHADVENRLPLDVLHELVAAHNPDGYFVAHNGPFEQSVSMACLGYKLPKLICTLQMAVSAYGPQQYDRDAWRGAGQGGIKVLIDSLVRASMTGLIDADKMEMSPELSELVFKILGKSSKSAFSWNGFLNSISYGYGLKQAVNHFFGHKMTTFEEVLGDKNHMGELTGQETVDYGCDDAYWAVRLFHRLMEFMVQNGGEKLVKTFFEQENPMVDTYADIRIDGMKVNYPAITARMNVEREKMAEVGVELKQHVRELLPFKPEPHEGLMKYDGPKWYQKGFSKYRTAIANWAASPNDSDPYQQCYQIRGPVSMAWAEERGEVPPTGPNFSHYMPVRTLIYDLTGTKVIAKDGKVESDGEARGKLRDRLSDNPSAVGIFNALGTIAGIEQRVKLYLKPYSLLADPSTGKMYPSVSCMLATRRMACSDPNGMQLAKRGESTYVRGFFEADYDDHVIVSIDWSAIELVEIGEFSGDPEFIKAFGQLPHADMHAGASTDILANVDCHGLTEERFKSLKGLKSWDDLIVDFENPQRLMTNLKGEPLSVDKAYGYWRTEIGKGANFNYWYSGWLATIGERMGWNQEQTKLATEAYRERFWVAEQWRVDKIREVQEHGYITLHDGHRYTRYEATQNWLTEWNDKFLLNNVGAESYNKVMQWIARKIQKRAGNQAVNADIQGSCATIAKRSIIRNNLDFKRRGWTKREARFMLPVHDELLFSVHHELVPEFVPSARGIMIDHPDMFTKCKLDASPSVGVTFEPWHETKSPLGQIELHELPLISGLVDSSRVNKRATPSEIKDVVAHLMDMRKRR